MQGTMDCETVNVKSRSEYYDSDKILSKWGFTDNQCHNCGVLNSDLNGLLMQCGKCKKAYYCGMKCFNDHLPEHQKFCGTKEICSEPKSKGSSPFKFERETKIIETFGVSDTKLNDASVYSEEISEYEEVSVTEEELDEEIAYTKDFQNSAHSLNLPESIPDHVNFYNSFSDFGRGATRQIPEREEWTMEEVDLRHAEQMKREYGWETPDWVDPRLRPTPHGQVLKNMGDIVSPVTHAKVLIEKGIIAWTVPDWTNPKLRKTSRGESIKRGTPHFDQSATKK